MKYALLIIFALATGCTSIPTHSCPEYISDFVRRHSGDNGIVVAARNTDFYVADYIPNDPNERTEYLEIATLEFFTEKPTGVCQNEDKMLYVSRGVKPTTKAP